MDPGTQRPLDPGRGIAVLVCVVSVLTPPLLAVARQRARARAVAGSGGAGAAWVLCASDASRARAAFASRPVHPAPFLITTVIAGAPVPVAPELAVPASQPVASNHSSGLEAATRSLALSGQQRTVRSSAPPRYRLAPKGSPPV